jgi:transcriptional regulator with XRE-family HTH domain
MIAIKKTIGKTIRKYRQRAGLTQMQLAEKLGITYQQVQKYEKGKSNITIERLYQIAEALRVSPAALLPDRERLFSLEEEKHNYEVEKAEEKIVKLFRKIKNQRLRKAILNLLKELTK